MTIATDIICAFPTETKEEFEETLSLVEKYRMPVVNISQFYPRPGTVAAKWKRVDTKEAKRRTAAMAKLFTTYPNYEHLKGTIQRVWIHDTRDEGKNQDENFMVAHTKSYAKVLIKRIPELVGKQVIVKVTDIHKWHVYGDIIDTNPKIIHTKFEDHFKGMYNVNKDPIAVNQFTEIKKEQEDIHATIITTSPKKVEERAQTSSNKNSKAYLTLDSLVYFLSILFLYIGLISLFYPKIY